MNRIKFNDKEFNKGVFVAAMFNLIRSVFTFKLIYTKANFQVNVLDRATFKLKRGS